MDSTNLDDSLEALDARIEEVKAELKELQYQRNLRVPICRLPPEILAKIFTHIPAVIPPFVYQPHKRIPPIPGFPVAMKVCRLWRMLALNTPAIWSKPDFLFPKIAEAMMDYAKSVPLEIDWPGLQGYLPEEKHMVQITRALERSDRIASVNIVARSAQLNELVTVMVNPAPFLRCVVLECLHGVFDLPDEFLREAPRLTRLIIRNGVGNIPWGSPMFQHLTVLLLTGTPNMESTIPLTMVVDTLQRAPNLQKLRLHDCLPLLSDVVSTDTQQIVLPRLEALYLYSRSQVLITLLHLMSFPDTVNLHLECVPLDSGVALLNFISTRFFSSTAPAAGHCRTFETLSCTSGHVSNLVITPTDPVAALDDVSCPMFDCQVTRGVPEAFSEGSMFYTGMLDVLKSTVTLTNLKTLTVDLGGISPEIMIQYFGALPHLENIYIESGCSPGGLKCLAHNLPNPQNEGRIGQQTRRPQAIIFPALTTLRMSEINFGGYIPLVGILADTLKVRLLHGASVGTVVFLDCPNLVSEDIEMLEDAVPGTVFRFYPYEDEQDDSNEE